MMAGGKGTRLSPLTEYAPKVMMSIHGRPFLYYLIKEYQKHDIVLSVNYMREAIKNWCRLTRNYLEFVDEPEFYGTGGALRLAKPFLHNKRKFAVVNGDTILLNEDLAKLGKVHDYKKDVATVIYAKDVLDGKRKHSGMYIFSQSIFDYVKSPKVFNIEDKLDQIPHKICESNSTFLDIGSHEGLAYAKKNLFREHIKS